MNISYKWLKEYVDLPLTPDETAAALTSIGLEVGSVEEVPSVKGGLRGLVVGEVLTCEPHPNSDHMHICTVDLGGGAIEQIVCGASNVGAGEKVIVATLGTKLYDGDKEFTIKKSKLRGVESNGMICAEDEIGIGTDHSGIIVLPAEAEVGTPAAVYYGLESDYLIEVDITPNHADACSHWGVARDLYAWLIEQGYAVSLHRPSVEGFAVESHALDIDVVVENTEACPRYAAVTIKGCSVGESPKWLKDKLTTVGLRPINNIVDITNYIVMAFGQPLHCFDADMIAGGRVVVRTLPEGTPFITLDGQEHKLSARDLAICNAEEAMCIAGVFGGKGSGTYETTTNVLFESAYFHPSWIRKSARRHGLQTDASFRFERGIDPAGQLYALKLAALMAKELAGGEIAMDIKDITDASLPQDAIVEFDYQYCHDLVGKEIPVETMQRICRNLGMQILASTETGMTLQVPAYRVDVTRPCDVVEEILRIYGYDNVEIGTQLRSSLTVKGALDKHNKLQQLISEQLVGAGFSEIMNNSLTKTSYYEPDLSHNVQLLNPLSKDLGVLRRTLLFGGLETLARNVNRKLFDLRCFEFGHCYDYNGEKKSDLSGIVPSAGTSRRILAPYSEGEHLGLWLTGKRVRGSWAHPDEDSSIHELKAHLLNIFRRVGLPFGAIVFSDLSDEIFSQGQAIRTRQGKTLATYGLVSAQQTAKVELQQAVYFAEIDWDVLMQTCKAGEMHFAELSKYPAVSRDLALLLDQAVPFVDIERIAYSQGGKVLREVSLFDVYEGKNMEPGKKSYAVRFLLQDEQRTMGDKQIDAIMQKIESALCRQLGASVRGKDKR